MGTRSKLSFVEVNFGFWYILHPFLNSFVWADEFDMQHAYVANRLKKNMIEVRGQEVRVIFSRGHFCISYHILICNAFQFIWHLLFKIKRKTTEVKTVILCFWPPRSIPIGLRPKVDWKCIWVLSKFKKMLPLYETSWEKKNMLANFFVIIQTASAAQN